LKEVPDEENKLTAEKKLNNTFFTKKIDIVLFDFALMPTNKKHHGATIDYLLFQKNIPTYKKHLKIFETTSSGSSRYHEVNKKEVSKTIKSSTFFQDSSYIIGSSP